MSFQRTERNNTSKFFTTYLIKNQKKWILMAGAIAGIAAICLAFAIVAGHYGLLGKVSAITVGASAIAVFTIAPCTIFIALKKSQRNRAVQERENIQKQEEEQQRVEETKRNVAYILSVHKIPQIAVLGQWNNPKHGDAYWDMKPSLDKELNKNVFTKRGMWFYSSNNKLYYFCFNKNKTAITEVIDKNYVFKSSLLFENGSFEKKILQDGSMKKVKQEAPEISYDSNTDEYKKIVNEFIKSQKKLEPDAVSNTCLSERPVLKYFVDKPPGYGRAKPNSKESIRSQVIAWDSEGCKCDLLDLKSSQLAVDVKRVIKEHIQEMGDGEERTFLYKDRFYQVRVTFYDPIRDVDVLDFNNINSTK